MKKLIFFSLAAWMCASVSAQEINTEMPDKEKEKKIVSLDGKSYKVSFTEKKEAAVKQEQDGNAAQEPASKSASTPETYPMFDANSKVVITFSDGLLMSPIFVNEGCAYRVNTSGGDMYAFTAYCRLNTGGETSEPKRPTPESRQDTKLEMDADRALGTNMHDPDHKDVVNAPAPAPVDPKQEVPAGTVRDNENLNPVPPSAATRPAPVVTPPEQMQNQTESPVQSSSRTMATISGVISGNSIYGTLSWTEADGSKVSYSYTGNAVSRKDVSDSKVVGLR